MITDVVVADVCDAARVGEDFQSNAFVWTEISRCQIQRYVELLSILSNRRVSKKLYKDFPLVFEDPDREVAVYKLSDELVTLVSKIKDKSIPEIAILWSEAAVGYSNAMALSKHATEALIAFRKMTKIAIRRKKTLLLRETP